MTDGDRPADRDRDEDLQERLAELEDVLSRLRSDLHDEAGTRSRVPRPPSPAELLRFTERYTLPTVIALLEAAIRSLELLRATLRLADPERRGVVDGPDGVGSSDRLADVRDGTAAGVRRTLSELRTALSAADFPREATSRDLLEDARALSAEIDELLAESTPDSGSEAGSDRDAPERRSDPGEGVSIDVRDPDTSPNSDSDSASTVDEDSDSEASSSGTADDSSPPAVDVDAELESIKDELADDDTESGDEKAGEEPDEAASDGEETGSNEASGNEPDGDEASENGSDGDEGSVNERSGDDDTTASGDPAA